MIKHQKVYTVLDIDTWGQYYFQDQINKQTMKHKSKETNTVRNRDWKKQKSTRKKKKKELLGEAAE